MAPTSQKSNQISYKKAVELFNKGNLHPAYLIFGEEKFLHDELIDKILSIGLDAGTRDFNFDLFYASETSIDKIINIAMSFPMMAERRIVVVKDIQHLKATELKYLAGYVQKPSKSTILILTLPERKKTGKNFNEIYKNIVAIECRKLYDSEIPAWIQGYLGSKNFEIENQAIQLLHAQVGNSLLSLVNELEKIEINIHPKIKITVEDIQTVTSISKQFNIFELCNSVGKKNFSQAVSILNKLLEQGEQTTGMIIQLGRHIVNLLKIKENIRLGKKSTNDLMRVTGLSYYFVNDIMRQSKNFTNEQLRNAFQFLAAADLHLKTGYQNPGLVMELLLYRIIKM
jgi:DNA polymerase-3 subunit delta